MKNVKNIFAALGVVALLAGCSENDWNDRLDGFESYQPGTSTESLTYTLTAADYTKIATKKPYTAYAAEHEQSDALALIGSTQSFADEAQALEYMPMFLRDSTNTFYALANGSAIKVTYNVSTQIPEVVKNINANTSTLTLTEAQYQEAWGSTTDYINGFSPANAASKHIPGILKAEYPDAKAGDYAVVTYNQASENPIFGTIGSGEGEGGGETEWAPTSVLGSVAVGDNVTVRGYVTAIDNRGFVLTDASGSILCYQSSGFELDDVFIGDELNIEASITSYGTALQIAVSGTADYTVTGSIDYEYPAPKKVTGADMDAAVTRTTDELCQYVCYEGVASVGSYINFTVDGAETAVASGYQVPSYISNNLTDGERYIITGYFCSVSSGKYYNTVITDVTPVGKAAAPVRAPRRAAVNEVSLTAANAIYTFNGSSWSAPSKVVVLQPGDYTAMGQNYPNLSGTLPAKLLPKYLAQKYPYAAAEDEITVAYNYYNGSTSAYTASQYIFNGSEWTCNTGEVTSQFVKRDGFWIFDPSVVLTLPYSRNTDPSYTYYMACVNWVFDNVGKELGGTSLNDSPFIDYRGNAEFWSGASAYYGNVDVRAITARNNAPADYTGYDGLDDDQISALIKERFVRYTFPGALAALHSEAVPMEGMEVTYTINFTAYTGSAEDVTVVYAVVAPGEFKYKSCTWFTNGEDAEW